MTSIYPPCKRLSLSDANRLASSIVEALSPYCARIEVAGSIRRRLPAVGDIDIVCLPKADAYHQIRERCLRTNPTVRQDGRQQLLFVLGNNVQVDLWFATHPVPGLFSTKPGTWATRLLCRTGSMLFNTWFASQAKARGLHWNPYWGIYRPGHEHPIETETEADLFKVLSLDYIAPEARSA